MPRPLLIIGALLLAIGFASRSACAQAWVRLHVRTASGEQFAGSGAVVSVSGQTAAILTAAHVVEGSVGGRVEFATGATGQIREHYLDKTGVDLALVIVDCQGPIPPPMQLGEWQPGQTAAWHGYGAGTYATAAGPTADGRGVPQGWPDRDATLAAPCRSGDSGAPVVDRNGHLIGVVWGCEPPTPQSAGTTHFAPITPVRDFLRRCFGHQPWRAGGFIPPASPTPTSPPASPPANCPGGVCPPLNPGWQTVPPPAPPQAPILPPPTPPPTLPTPPSPPPAEPPRLEPPPLELPAPLQGDQQGSSQQSALSNSPPHSPFSIPHSTFSILIGALSGSGIAAIVASLVARRALKRIQRSNVSRDAKRSAEPQQLPTAHGPLPSTVIPVDTPPRTIHAKTETHYVPIDDGRFDRAYAWASEQVARKFPGASDVLAALDSLIKQHLAATPPK